MQFRIHECFTNKLNLSSRQHSGGRTDYNVRVWVSAIFENTIYNILCYFWILQKIQMFQENFCISACTHLWNEFADRFNTDFHYNPRFNRTNIKITRAHACRYVRLSLLNITRFTVKFRNIKKKNNHASHSLRRCRLLYLKCNTTKYYYILQHSTIAQTGTW